MHEALKNSRRAGAGRLERAPQQAGRTHFFVVVRSLFERSFALRARSRQTSPYLHVYCYMLAIRPLSGGTVPRRHRAGPAELRFTGASLPRARPSAAQSARAAAKGGAEPEYVFGACAAGALSVLLTLCGGDNERGRKMAVPTNPVDKFWYNFYFAKPQQSDWERQLQEFADSKARGAPVCAVQSRSPLLTVAPLNCRSSRACAPGRLLSPSCARHAPRAWSRRRCELS